MAELTYADGLRRAAEIVREAADGLLTEGSVANLNGNLALSNIQGCSGWAMSRIAGFIEAEAQKDGG